MSEKKNRLKEILLEKAVKFGDFTLASGQKSTYYINGKLATLDSEGLNLMAEIMLDMLEDTEIDAIGGPTLGADPMIGAVIALAHNRGRKLTGFIVRKESKDHGTKSLVEGPVAKGMKVVIIEDVATTGGSATKAIEAARAAGCEIVKVMVIVDRGQGATEHFQKMKIPYEAIFSKEELGL
ncbi:MAG: orotate phosphoribosyltransferase [candidate division Zixibacteria bacterium]